MKRACLLAGLLFASALLPAACNTTSPHRFVRLEVAIREGGNLMRVGDRTQMSATLISTDEASSLDVTQTATWSLEGTAGVATISATGQVTAVAAGEGAAVARYGAFTGQQTIRVQ